MRFNPVLLALASLSPCLALAAPPSRAVDPLEAPTPAVLLAQAEVDDSDLQHEETLVELMQIEYDKDAWSMGAAVGLSLLPGGGYGLMYADKKAQASVPLLLFAAGTAVGVTYLLGVFDESQSTVCSHVRDGTVGYDECTIGQKPGDNLALDPRADNYDASTNTGDPYFKTKGDYSYVTRGEDFDGTETGLIILAGTYAATSLLGAIWAGTTVAEHNDQLKKDIESTAQAPVQNARPVASYDGNQGFFGFAFEF